MQKTKRTFSLLTRAAQAVAALSLSLTLSLCGSPARADGPAAEAWKSDVVFQALRDELTRSMDQLQLKDLERPYFIEYSVLDSEFFTATATFGALVSSSRGKNRTLLTQVRVGGYEFDNTDFVGPSVSASGMVEDNDYVALRRDVWLATDAAYKQAVETLASKRAYVQNRVRKESLPDFSRERPTMAVAPRREFAINQAEWEKRVRDWSLIFRRYPDVQESSVAFRATLAHRYLINSEGTTVRQPSFFVTVEARAATQAADGMQLRLSVPFYAKSYDGLPTDADIAAGVKKLAESLAELRAAPALESNYVGPVLLSGSAAATLFSQNLAPELSGQRPSLLEQERSEGTQFAERVNRRVLPLFLSVRDDPTQTMSGNTPLFGAYEFDDQGVPAQRVSLVEQGILKNFLMSRRPRKDVAQSNGHGRLAGFGVAAQTGNLFITAAEGKTDAELKAQLIKLCQLQDLEYGVFVKALDGDGNPALVYKVFAKDGREEPFRGATLGEITVRSLKNEILAAGKDAHVSNRISGRNFPIGYSVVAPSILLEELELKPPTGTQQKPALLTHPYFDKGK
jgi:TldD protein